MFAVFFAICLMSQAFNWFKSLSILGDATYIALRWMAFFAIFCFGIVLIYTFT